VRLRALHLCRRSSNSCTCGTRSGRWCPSSFHVVTWRSTASGAYSAKSAYNLFFLARLLIPCAKEL
jgi:hypothetical protein